MNRKRRAAKQARQQRNHRKKETAVAMIRASLDPVQEQYANNWSVGHASHFSSQGDYEWMAEFLKGCHRIVQVGTGDGSGTIALCRNGSVVVSIETNPFCLELAQRKLQEAGIPVVVQARGRIIADSTDSYEMVYETVREEMPKEGVLLLGGDVTHDHELAEWIIAHTPFDGVAFWNIGTHRLHSDVTSKPSEYRLIVQNRVYEMAHRVLRSGGVLHIVDRGRAPTEEHLPEMIRSQLEGHRDQASVTDLEVDPSISHRVYEPPADGASISMQAADTSTFQFDDRSMAFWSIVSRKS